MNSLWRAVHESAVAVCSRDSLRVANLAIAAAVFHFSVEKSAFIWDGKVAKERVIELALSPLCPLSDDKSLWQQVAEHAREAAYLGQSLESMHSWAVSYQYTAGNQKEMGAYATHNAFASTLARIAMNPLERNRIYRVVDPSAGAGNLLLAVVENYGRNLRNADLKRLILSLHGAELDVAARELCCLLLWLSGAHAGVALSEIARNIRLTNALTFDWWSNGELFEVLLMNPPWESLRHKVNDDSSSEREATLERLAVMQPGAVGLPPLFSAQGTGDRNLFKLFVELAPHLIVEGGRLGALLPSSFASDSGLSILRERYLTQFEIAKWTGYENRAGYFPIDKRYKFGLLSATRSNLGTKRLLVRAFAEEPDEVDAPHIELCREDIELLGHKYHAIPELWRQQELTVLRKVLSHGDLFFQSLSLGHIRYRREVDLSLDKDSFHHITFRSLVNRGDATFVDEEENEYVPLLEGRSVGAYDCFQKSWVSGAGRKAVWRKNAHQELHSCSPQYVTKPAVDLPPRVAVCDVTAATNQRTVIATWVPSTWRCGNTAPVLEFECELYAFAGLGILNSMIFDWIARRRTSGLHLNKFILEGLVWPKLDEFDIEAIAFAAWSICLSNPRGGLTVSQRTRPPWLKQNKAATPMKYVAAATLIETTVARGLGLNAEDLYCIYDPDRGDRRGFWRYFEAEPLSVEVVRASLRSMPLPMQTDLMLDS